MMEDVLCTEGGGGRIACHVVPHPRAAAARRCLATLGANLGRRFLPSPDGCYFLIELFTEEMVNN